MKIKSLLNNSALIACKEKGEEVVLIGKGISFNKHPGDEVDPSKIEKEFQMHSLKTNQLLELIETIPDKYLEVSSTIVRYASKKLKKELDKSIYVTLTDHIHSAIERYQEGIELSFGMMEELKHLFPKENEIARWALDYINAVCDVNLPEDECGFMAVHLISAQSQNTDLSLAKKVMKIVSDVSVIVQRRYGENIDQDGLFYSRFMTHLKYFAIRYLNHTQIDTDDLCFQFNREFEQIQDCVSEVSEMMEQKYHDKLSAYEENYLKLHIYILLRK